MYFKKGLLLDVDQRHYFRDDVFATVSWHHDSNPSKAHLERAKVNFQIIIDGIDVGTYELKLTHNTRTNTATYRQRNAMTQLHWGEMINIIRDRGLLGKFITLYHQGDDEFQMEIN